MNPRDLPQARRKQARLQRELGCEGQLLFFEGRS